MKTELAKDNPYMRMVVNILRSGNIIDHRVSEVLKEFEITHIQFNILRILEAVHPKTLSVGEINNELLFPTSDVTRILNRLVNRGLVLRTICPQNRRKMDVSITDKGLRVIANSLPKIKVKLNNYYSNVLNDQERDQVIDILRRISKENDNN